MSGWAKAPMDRKQAVLFSPNLDAMIGDDHPVRLFDELLGHCDWSAWEGRYCRVRGQPPIHPRIVAGVILYGLSRAVRSSRTLEYMLGANLDFMWLAHGRSIDHATLCKFRTRFGEELKLLFRDIFRIALRAGLAKLECVALDATRVKADSSRHATASSATLEKRLAELDAQVEQMLQEAADADAADNDLLGQQTPNKLPRPLANMKRRQERLRAAMAVVKAKDAARASRAAPAKDGATPVAKPAKTPVADPESHILPNKGGGFAPNYTPAATAEGHGGFIVDPHVPAGGELPEQIVETIDRIETQFGQRPDEALADSAYNSGAALAALDDRDVTAYIPPADRSCDPANPARRDDPTTPVAEADWASLPKRARTKKLDRAAFVYDPAGDRYLCPMGRTLAFWQVQSVTRRAGPTCYRVYRCATCAGCPLADQCVSSRTGLRTVRRDQHEHHREAMDVRLASESGRATYARRAWIAETPFAGLKATMGLRQFAHRGLAKVRIEWLWHCTAYNLGKLMRQATSVRAHLAVGAA